MKHLLFQLAAPLMSFGSPGAKQERATDSYPSKGFALGFLGAALGKKRDDPWHELNANLGFAVLTVRPGTRVEDYHTVATPRGTDQYATRREEVEASDYTVETWREYLSDGCFILAFWGGDLGEAREALEYPTFELFAGRKSCPLSLPPDPVIIEANTLAYGFRLYCEHHLYFPFVPKENRGFSVHWEQHLDPGIPVDRAYLRKDQIVNRAKRLFKDRTEFEGALELGG